MACPPHTKYFGFGFGLGSLVQLFSTKVYNTHQDNSCCHGQHPSLWLKELKRLRTKLSLKLNIFGSLSSFFYLLFLRRSKNLKWTNFSEYFIFFCIRRFLIDGKKVSTYQCLSTKVKSFPLFGSNRL